MTDEKPGSNNISPDLVNQAPAKMPEIVRSMHATAAQALEDAATMLEQEMQSHIQLMRDEASSLRAQGENQANTIEALSVLIRDTHKAFQVQADRLASFRMGDRNEVQEPRARIVVVDPPSALSDELNRSIEQELSKLPRGKGRT